MERGVGAQLLRVHTECFDGTVGHDCSSVGERLMVLRAAVGHGDPFKKVSITLSILDSAFSKADLSSLMVDSLGKGPIHS